MKIYPLKHPKRLKNVPSDTSALKMAKKYRLRLVRWRSADLIWSFEYYPHCKKWVVDVNVEELLKRLELNDLVEKAEVKLDPEGSLFVIGKVSELVDDILAKYKVSVEDEYNSRQEVITQLEKSLRGGLGAQLYNELEKMLKTMTEA